MDNVILIKTNWYLRSKEVQNTGNKSEPSRSCWDNEECGPSHRQAHNNEQWKLRRDDGEWSLQNTGDN